MSEKEKCYKGFNKGLVCKGKQYAENTVFEEGGGEICGNGVMHYCKDPLDVLEYYPLLDANGEFNEYAEVEPLDEEQQDGDKFATKKLKIKAKFSFAGFVKDCIDFVFEKAEIENASSGDYAQITSTGKNSVICCAGHGSIVKAKIGSFITLSEWKAEDGQWIPLNVETVKVDGVNIKEDTFYTMKNCEIVEVEDE